MNILLINHYAGSKEYGMEYRPYYLAKEWKKMGHRVTIVSSSFSHLRTKKVDISVDLVEEKIEGICYVWVKTPEYQGNGARRVINMLSFAKKIYSFSKVLVNKYSPDLIIASSPHPFIIYGASRMKKISKAHLFFEVRDLWPLTLTELGRIPAWNPFITMMQLAENYAYSNADKVISLLPKAKDYMVEHGMNPNKFLYIPNGFDTSEWLDSKESVTDVTEQEKTIEKLKQEGNFIVGYAGTHGLANALDDLIKAAEILAKEPIKFILLGHGPEKNKLQQLAKDLNLNNIIFLLPVHKSKIPTILNLMDILYIGWKKERLYRFGISPNKLMDYMMASKPVVHAVDAGNDLVFESGCGISVYPECPDEIAKAVKALYNMDEQRRRIMGEKGRKYIIANHDYKILATKFLM